MTAGEEMAKLMGEQDGEQGEGERQARGQGRRVSVKKGEGVEEFVERNSLILRVSDGKLSAGNQARAKSKKKQEACDEEHPKRRTRWDGFIRRFDEWNGAPIQIDRNGWWRVFWEWCAHEVVGAINEIDMNQYSTSVRARASCEPASRLFVGMVRRG